MVKLDDDSVIQAALAKGMVDEKIRDAVVAYIHTLTEQLHEWREVYRKQSGEVRILEREGPNPLTAESNWVVEVAVFMIVRYHDRQKVGKINAFLDHPGVFQNHWCDHVAMRHESTIVEEVAFTAESYADAVDRALELWPGYVATFEQRTEDMVMWELLTRYEEPRLKAGDQLLITQAFWDEKEERRVAKNFNFGEWSIGKSATIDDVYTDSGRLCVYVTGESGAGTTSVYYETALDMRKAWLDNA